MFNARTVLISVCRLCLLYPTIAVCSSIQHLLSSFSFFFLILLFSLTVLFSSSTSSLLLQPFSSHFLFFSVPFSRPVTPFHHHSFVLRPHLSISGPGRAESESESATLTLSISTFVLSFSPDMIWVIRLGDRGSLCALRFFLPCEFRFL